MRAFRLIAERLSRGMTIKRHIIVNGKKTPLIVSPDAQLKYLKLGLNAFDSDLIQIAEKFLKPNSNVWDIGANIGIFTFAAAVVAYQGTILSVEADIWLAGIIRKSTQLYRNRNKDIRVLPAAVSELDSVQTFVIAKRGRASNSLETASGRSQSGGVREKQYVPTLTLDNLTNFFPAPDFIKIDVEGAELAVLKGGSKVIAGVRPSFYIEVGTSIHTASEMQRILKREGYRLFDGTTWSPVDNCTYNTIFIPEEKCAETFL